MNQVNKIKILSAEQAIKIAAGEVVERPVNIIKEIVENSIDAGATKISIFIHGSGKLLIKIIDNGIGMTPDDVKLSVAQHATSKITSVEDLETIATFGFRGEALASINSVSNLTITSKTYSAHTGTRIKWNFGRLVQEALESHPTGTTLEIANLFDNIPARQKFLKKDETEWRAIVTLFQAFCFDYQSIHFQLYNEDKLQFNCPPVTNITDRAAQLFETNLQEKILNLVDLKNNFCSVTGMISSPTYYRYDRNQIFIFVNNRWVKNIDLTKAIMRGYAGTLPPQKYPVAIIFINIDADQVDVNIHPKKEEVKFLHPKKVETLIINSIKTTLEETITNQLQKTPQSTIFQTGFHSPQLFSFLQTNYSSDIKQNYEHQVSQSNSIDINPLNKTPLEPYKEIKQHDELTFMPPQFAAHAFTTLHQNTPQPAHATRILDKTQTYLLPNKHHEVAIVGQYKQTYVLFEKDNNLVFVDQHAAHERILYEQFKSNFHSIATIQLIFPEFIKLQAFDVVTITPHLNLLKNHGIGAEIFSDTQLIIQTTPVHLKNQLLQEMVQQFIGWIIQMDETEPARMKKLLNEKIHTKMACSAAIKAGDLLNLEQMQQLLRDLSTIENRFSCPHGRPTFWILPIDHLEKQFKRDYGKKSEQFYDFL